MTRLPKNNTQLSKSDQSRHLIMGKRTIRERLGVGHQPIRGIETRHQQSHQLLSDLTKDIEGA
jgi:hypothetical protein